MVKLGIIGTGSMANSHATAFNKIKSCKVVACCDIAKERVKTFAKKYNIGKIFTDVDEMLSSVKLDAVSVVTGDQYHAEVSLKAIEKGLHVLCEKPLATSEKDARRMEKLAKGEKVITAVNFSYRNSPAVEKANKIVNSGRLGRIIHVEASYLQSWLSSKGWGDWKKSQHLLWRLSRKHHSQGTLGDIGVHIYDMVSFIAGDFQEIYCLLKTFDKGVKRIGEYILDANDSFISMIKFKNGSIGTIHSTRFGAGYSNSLRVRIFGNKGSLEVDLDKSWDSLRICAGNKNIDKCIWKEIRCPEIPTIYERFITSIRRGKQHKPDFSDGAKVQRYLDKSFLSDKLNKWIKL